jgi:hypothetical protein
VLEIVSDFRSDTFRAVYSVLPKRPFTFCMFSRRSPNGGIATPRHEMELVEKRLARVIPGSEYRWTNRKRFSALSPVPPYLRVVEESAWESTFHFTAKLGPAAVLPSESPDVSHLAGVSILVYLARVNPASHQIAEAWTPELRLGASYDVLCSGNDQCALVTSLIVRNGAKSWSGKVEVTKFNQ